MAKRNPPLATWDVNDPYDRPLRLYRPTTSLPYFSATWYQPGIERQQRTTLATDEAAARRWCTDKADRLRRAQRRRRPERPLEPGQRLVDAYLDPANHPGWGSQRTATKAANLARCFISARLRALPCELWSTEDLQDILRAARPGHEQSYVQDVRNMLSGLVQVGRDLGYLDLDQINMSAVKVPKLLITATPGGRFAVHGEHDEDHPGFRVDRLHLPGRERITALAAQLCAIYEVMVLLATYSGMRWGELAALTVADIDEAARTIRVDRAWAEDTDGATWLQLPKNRRTRTTFYPAFLQPGLAAVIAQARQTGNPKALVFPAARGGHLRRSNFGTRHWRPAHVRAGWDDRWSFHTLRHCAAVWMIYDQRYDLNDVAAVLGHADATITQRIYVQAREGVAERLATRAVLILASPLQTGDGRSA